MNDFDSKLRLVSRFDELRREPVNALLLGVNYADKALDLCAIAGLCAIVEIPVKAADVLDRHGLREATRWLETTVRNLAGRPALSGFLIDCPPDPGMNAPKPSHFRQATSTLIDAIRGSAHDRAIVAIRRRLAMPQLAIFNENLTYVGTEWLNLSEIPGALRAARAIAGSRPLIVELSGRHVLDSGLLAALSASDVAGVVYGAAPIAPPLSAAATSAGSLINDNRPRA